MWQRQKPDIAPTFSGGKLQLQPLLVLEDILQDDDFVVVYDFNAAAAACTTNDSDSQYSPSAVALSVSATTVEPPPVDLVASLASLTTSKQERRKTFVLVPRSLLKLHPNFVCLSNVMEIN